MKRALLVACSVVVILGIGLFFLRPTLKYSLFKGQQLEYTVSYSSNGQGTVGTSAGQFSKLQASGELQGSMIIKVQEVPDSKQPYYFLRYTFIPTKYVYKQNSRSNTELPQSIDFGVEMASDGEVITYQIDKTNFRKYSDIVRDVLSMFELVTPLSQYSKVWQADEKNYGITFPVELSYNPWSFDSDIVVSKRYLRDPKRYRVKGSTTYVFDGKLGAIKSLQGSKRVETKLPFSNKTYSAVNLKITSGLTDEAMKPLNYERIKLALGKNIDFHTDKVLKNDLTGKIDRDRIQLARFRNRMSKTSSQSIKDALLKVDENSDTSDLYWNIQALAKIKPEEVKLLAPLITSGELSKEAYSALMSALISVGTPEAQETLMTAASNANSIEQKKNIVGSSGFFQLATSSTEAALKSIASSDPEPSVRRVASLAVSNIAHFYAEQYPDRAEAVKEEYESKLESSQTVEEKIHNLSAIGNVGVDSVYDTVVGYLDSEDPRLRRKAYDALRFIDQPDARSHLLNALSDPDGQLREIVVEALQHTPGRSEDLEFYEERLSKETNQTVIQGLLKNVGELVHNEPNAMKLLDKYLVTCAVKKLCDYARSVKKEATY